MGQLHIQIDSVLKTATEIIEGEEVVTVSWNNALKAVAMEFQDSINPALVYMGKEPIAVNPESPVIEGFLGSLTTPPTDSEDWEYDGLTTVSIENYDFINSRFFGMLPAPPVTFWLLGGIPPMAGKIV